MIFKVMPPKTQLLYFHDGSTLENLHSILEVTTSMMHFGMLLEYHQ
jgi:hypothetical protein